ncbi:hypothetical protein BCR35DRAFT_298136 [Leucosporidium creatinivorum]|uniref:Uncharacterized protein n=1 Tax=Leucosporidium creatinivorum TaxID=106004 RepID=A0A1Y2G3Y5_9BASI|nr:hypothetical protein BCR35DRAFT_298136 [Leucosporidium creatinivorum]
MAAPTRSQPRHKSLSLSSSTTNPFHGASSPPSPSLNGGRNKGLKQSSSIADLRQSFTTMSKPKFLRRFTSRDKDLFGCAGEEGAGGAFTGRARGSSDLDLDELDEEDDTEGREGLPPYANAPPRPPQVGLDDSCWTKEHIREVERRKEELAAEEALAAFFARQSISSPSPQPIQTTFNTLSESSSTPSLSRSDSMMSFTTSSSRPRTNESLPSYHSNAPPSPVSERGGTLRRPKTAPAPNAGIALADVVAEPRRYDYI